MRYLIAWMAVIVWCVGVGVAADVLLPAGMSAIASMLLGMPAGAVAVSWCSK